jgi:hypothetical protein
MLDRFLKFSAEVTDFTVFHLNGTGQSQAYFDMVVSVLGEKLVGELLDVYDRIPAGKASDRERHLRREIFGDMKLGPIARNIVKIWYVGIWYELPHEWTESFGAIPANTTKMVSPSAYTEGLLWPAIGANPPGAKAPGYASWEGPPKIPTY